MFLGTCFWVYLSLSSPFFLSFYIFFNVFIFLSNTSSLTRTVSAAPGMHREHSLLLLLVAQLIVTG